jgi:phospholipid transport system substrate-binding protein
MKAALNWGRAAYLTAGLLAPVSAWADLPSASAAPVKALGDGLLTSMKAGAAASFDQRFETLAPIVERVFDLSALLRACVGPRWSTLSPEEKATLADVFRRFTVASYVANFASFHRERFEILPGQRMIGPDQVVATRLVGETGDGPRLDYVMHKEHGTWKAVDVLLDGTISRVAVQRSDFRSALDAGGVGALVTSLEQKIADYKNGADGN